MSAPLTQTQIPNHSILDINGRQTYLGNSFVLPNAGTSLTDTNPHPLVVIKNPAGSGKSIFLFNRKLSTDLNVVLIKFYANPTTNVLGSATAAVNLRSGATTTSIAQCYLGATITSNGTLLTVVPASTYGFSSDLLYVIDPGNSILITGTQETAGTTTAISENAWYEI